MSYSSSLPTHDEGTWQDFRLRLVNQNFGTMLSIMHADSERNFVPGSNNGSETHVLRSHIRSEANPENPDPCVDFNEDSPCGKYKVRLIEFPVDYNYRYSGIDLGNGSPLWTPKTSDINLIVDWSQIDGFQHNLLSCPACPPPPFGFGMIDNTSMHPFHWHHFLLRGDAYYALNAGDSGIAAFAVGRIPVGHNDPTLLKQILISSIERQDVTKMDPAMERRILVIAGNGISGPGIGPAEVAGLEFRLARMSQQSPGLTGPPIGISRYLNYFMEPLVAADLDFENALRTGIRSLLGKGVGMLLYFGHGNPTELSEVLPNSIIPSLPKRSISHVASVTCQSGAMGDAPHASAAEQMVLSEVAGTVFASTWRTGIRIDGLDDLFQRSLRGPRPLTIGGAWYHLTDFIGLVGTADLNAEGRKYVVFGDPTAPFVQGRDADLDGLENFSTASSRQGCDLHTPQRSFRDTVTTPGLEPWLVDYCLDNCPFLPNPSGIPGSDSTLDRSDAVGDACDNCPDSLNAWQDVDSEGRPLCGSDRQPVGYLFNVPIQCESRPERSLCFDLEGLPIPSGQNIRIRYIAMSSACPTSVRVRAIPYSLSSNPLPLADAASVECTPICGNNTVCVHSLKIQQSGSYRLLIDTTSHTIGGVEISGLKILPEEYPIQFTSRMQVPLFVSQEEWSGRTAFLNSTGASDDSVTRGFVGVVNYPLPSEDTIAPRCDPNSVTSVTIPGLAFGDDVNHILSFDLYTFVPPWYDPGYQVVKDNAVVERFKYLDESFRTMAIEVFREAGLVRIRDDSSVASKYVDIPFWLSGENPRKVNIPLSSNDLAGIRDATIEFCVRGYGAYGVDNVMVRQTW